MVRTGAIGEWAAPFATPSSPDNYAVWYEAQRLVAKARWRNENSQAGSPTSSANIEQVVATYEAMDAEFGIRDLRWGLQHADFATPGPVEPAQEPELRRVDVRLPLAERCPARRRVAGGAALSADHRERHPGRPARGRRAHRAAQPLVRVHYATTGLNVLGQQINPGQQISRQEALYAYTRANAWYLNRENDLGSIEVGKLADLVVLDRDYFSVSDATMRGTRPVLPWSTARSSMTPAFSSPRCSPGRAVCARTNAHRPARPQHAMRSLPERDATARPRASGRRSRRDRGRATSSTSAVCWPGAARI